MFTYGFLKIDLNLDPSCNASRVRERKRKVFTLLALLLYGRIYGRMISFKCISGAHFKHYYHTSYTRMKNHLESFYCWYILFDTYYVEINLCCMKLLY